MVESLANTTSASRSAASDLANSIVASINDLESGCNGSRWLAGIEINDARPTAHCGEQRQKRMSFLTCLSVVQAVKKADLSSRYLVKHGDVNLLQVARAGCRLHAWLNLIYHKYLTHKLRNVEAVKKPERHKEGEDDRFRYSRSPCFRATSVASTNVRTTMSTMSVYLPYVYVVSSPFVRSFVYMPIKHTYIPL